MTDNFDTHTGTGDREIARIRGPVARKSHSIRFSDAEWLAIQKQAEENDMMPGEYVRHAALSLGAGTAAAIPAELSPALVRLIVWRDDLGESRASIRMRLLAAAAS